jgi:hypothetical protein
MTAVNKYSQVSALEDFLFGDGSAKALLATDEGLSIAELVQKVCCSKHGR